MADQYRTSMIESSRNISFDTAALLTTSTINTLHFPGLITSGMSDSNANRRTSTLLDGLGMCESMTESFCSTNGQDDSILNHNTNTLQLDTSGMNNPKLERKDSTKKRRSRKAQYDASIDGTSLDKIEAVNVIDEQNEPDDAWLYEVPKNGHKTDPTTDNIFSWVHKEFKTNDINANKHRLLCKLDDMSHARTIRSVSCHNFLDNQRSDSVKRSSIEQQVNSGIINEISTIENIPYRNKILTLSTISLNSIEKLLQQYSSLDSLDYDDIISISKPVKNGRLSSPLRTTAPLFNEHGNTRSMSPANLSTFRPMITMTNINGNYTNNSTVAAIERSREVSREREKGPFDYTDLEVMAKVQLQNLRQAERQGPLSKRFGGSNVSLASTNSGTSVCVSNRTGAKPPVAPKSAVIRNSVKPNSYQRSNTQTIVSSSCDVLAITESKPSVTLSTRVSLLPPNSVNNIRTRPPTARPIQPYRGSQTTFNNNSKVQVAPSSAQRNGKTLSNDFGSILTTKKFPTNENGLLNDVSNKPLTASIRSQVGPQRRTILPQSSTHSSIEQIPPSSSINEQTTLPRSSSSLSQGRKSGIPTVGKQLKPGTATVTRPTTPNAIPFFKSSDSMMVTGTVQTQGSMAYRQMSNLTSSWNDGCY